MINHNTFGRCATIEYGTGDVKEIAEIVGYINEPTYKVVNASGEVYSWVQSLVKPCSDQETIEYWRKRALLAEKSLNGPRQ